MEENVPALTLSQRIVQLTKAYIGMLEDVLGIVTLEARLALKSVIYIGLILGIIVLLLVCSWICVLGSLFVGLHAIGFKSFVSFLILAALNLGLILPLLYLIMHFKENFKFNATRRQLNTIVDSKGRLE